MGIDTIVPAAGQGIRFGAEKQFYEVGGKPILIYTLQMLSLIDRIGRIILVVSRPRIKRVRKMMEDYHIAKVKKIVAGGARRIDSVRSGLKEVRSSLLLIHDAVRPLTSLRLVNRILDGLERYNAVIPGLPIRDTIKEVGGGFVRRTIPRKGLYTVQTPQGFKTDLLKTALRLVPDEDYTDEAQVLERAGLRVKIISGELTNIKVTDRKDITLFKRLL